MFNRQPIKSYSFCKFSLFPFGTEPFATVFHRILFRHRFILYVLNFIWNFQFLLKQMLHLNISHIDCQCNWHNFCYYNPHLPFPTWKKTVYSNQTYTNIRHDVIKTIVSIFQTWIRIDCFMSNNSKLFIL